jgi:hypothetical protein
MVEILTRNRNRGPKSRTDEVISAFDNSKGASNTSSADAAPLDPARIWILAVQTK